MGTTKEVDVKDIINQGIALGLGLGIAGKEQMEKLARAAEKRLGLTKKDSRAFIKGVVKKGAPARKDLGKELQSFVTKVSRQILPVTRAELDELRASLAKSARTAKPRRKTTKKA